MLSSSSLSSALIVFMFLAGSTAYMPVSHHRQLFVSSRPAFQAVCLAGFGGQTRPARKKKSKAARKQSASTAKRQSTVREGQRPKSTTPGAPAPSQEELRAMHMARVSAAVETHARIIAEGLQNRGYAIVDGFMDDAATATMRDEAAALLASGKMVPSKSTR